MEDRIATALLSILPSVVVFLTAFYLIKRFMDARVGERAADLRKDDRKQVLPLRLQAYERLTLFLERITPGPLVLRVHKGGMSAATLHGELLATIREEYEHNVTQQVYVGDKVWGRVRQARDETIRLINLSYEQVGGASSGIELSGRIFENTGKLSRTPSEEALIAVKEEVRRFF